MPIDFRHSERYYLYRQEQGTYRCLSLTTKAYAAYLGKLVDPQGGWLALNDGTPAEAFRHQCAGKLTQGDYRLLRRSVTELLDEGYLVLGEVVDGQFLPVGEGNYVAIRNWVPAQAGMTRRQTAAWHAERAVEVQGYRDKLATSRLSFSAESCAVSRLDGRVGPVRIDSQPSLDSAWTENSPNSENTNGTERALIPDHYHSGRSFERSHSVRTPDWGTHSRRSVRAGRSAQEANRGSSAQLPAHSPAAVASDTRAMGG